MKRINSVDELKKIEFEIMRYVHKISEDNGLTCFLGGGTLLGAVRHKGFIPWDDDVDVMLIRDEYEKLLKLIQEDKDSPYQIVSYRTNRDYYYPFAKVVDTRTRMIEFKKLPIPDLGVGIDVFPIDGLPKTKEGRKKYFHRIDRLRQIFDRLFYTEYSGSANERKERILRYILNSISLMIDRTAAKHKINESEFVASSVWGYGVKETFSRRGIERRIMLEFEQEHFYAPAGYVQYLTHHYGDYMKPPQQALRKCEHNLRAWYI